MNFSANQITRLAEIVARYDEDWDAKPDDDGAILVTFNPYTMHASYERLIKRDGSIERYDDNTGEYVPAELTACVGTYTTRDRIVRYVY